MEEDKDIKLADMLWSALWEEPERPTGKLWIWLLGGGIGVIILVAYFITKK